MVPYLYHRIDAMEKHIKKLELKIEYLKAQNEVNLESYYE